MTDFRTYVTETGFGLESTAKMTKEAVPITKLVIGDGKLADNLSPSDQKNLVNEIREYPLTIEKDENDERIWIARAEIPAMDGGFTINEAGVKTDDGYLYCYGRLPGDYKPLLEEGAAKSYTLRLRFIPGNASTLEVKIDPSVQFATPTDLNNAIKEHAKKQHPHEQYALAEDLLTKEKRLNKSFVFTIAQIHNQRRSLSALFQNR